MRERLRDPGRRSSFAPETRAARGARDPRDPRARSVVSAAILAILAVLSVLGCSQRAGGPELLQVVDVQPRDIDVGDRIEVIGINLPTGEGREAVVEFRGELRRPGQTPLIDQHIVVERAKVSGDKVICRTEDSWTKRCVSVARSNFPSIRS